MILLGRKQTLEKPSVTSDPSDYKGNLCQNTTFSRYQGGNSTKNKILPLGKAEPNTHMIFTLRYNLFEIWSFGVIQQ